MNKKRFDESGYQRKLRDPKWQRRRLDILQSANWKCQEPTCLSPELNLQIHHLYYVREREPWEYPDEAFLCLCENCHERRGMVERSLKIEIFTLTRLVPIQRLKSIVLDLVAQKIKEGSGSK